MKRMTPLPTRLMQRFAPVVALVSLAGLTASAQAKTVWPNGTKAAVVLTYDDALTSQLDHAVPALDAAGFKGTFFLTDLAGKDTARWRALAHGGHELGNHTDRHPCSSAGASGDAQHTSDSYTVAAMLNEIARQNAVLTELDGRDRHGFALPCGESKAGGRDYLEDLRQAKLVTYVRGVVTTPEDLSADVSKQDLFRVPSRSFAEGTTSTQLIDLVKQAEAGHGWAVFLFHGVGGDYLQVSDAAHREFVSWLAAHRKEVWVATLQQALDWAQRHPGE